MTAPDTKTRITAIVGPTCVGKSDLAIEVAMRFDGEIVSADSMQVYRYMDIGTGKPDWSIRQSIAHHMIDLVYPNEEYNAAFYVNDADKVIAEIQRRERNIFVAGGTGLYIRALCGGLVDIPSCSYLRQRYRRDARVRGSAYLYDELCKRDRGASKNIHPHDLTRIVRALEVLDLSGKSISEKREKHRFADTRYNCITIGLFMDRRELYEHIDKRVDFMMKQGLVEEVDRLIEMGYDESMKPLKSMCYKYIVEFRKGRRSIEDAVQLIKRDIRHYAKRQITWFKREDGIIWMSPFDREAIYKIVERHLTY